MAVRRVAPVPARAARTRSARDASPAPARPRPPELLPERPPFTTIWRTVAAIPAGEWASYGEVARRAGLPRGARLVAFALRRAPESARLPWHRVVAAGGRIAFPPGSREAAEQARRLARDGLRVEGGRIRGASRPVDPRAALDALLWRPDGD
jgi:methylated-DNA-protein-cysteine methyltransferase-like protein